MRDFKSAKPIRAKGNRLKKQRQSLDWKLLLHRLLAVSLFLGKLTLVVLFAGGLGLAGRALVHSGYFGVEAVRVENASRLSAEEIIGRSDIRVGGNIFDLDLELIGRKLEENPWVAGAEVRRVFPREVVIRIRERHPRAIINLGYLYYVDEEGVVFKLLDTADSLDFPAITGLDRTYLLEHPEEGHRLLRDAVGLLRELEGRRVFTLAEVSELHIDPEEGLRLHTTDGGVPVHLGFADFSGKLDRLERIYPELQGRLSVLKYIDLNVADRVIVKVEPRRSTDKG